MSAIYLTEADVGRLVTVKDAIVTLEELFANPRTERALGE